MKTLRLFLFLLLVAPGEAAVTTRYFSTSAAGAADGTSWANRAALFSGGNWSTVISGFDFTANSLLCLVEGGLTYTCGQALTSSVTGTPDPSSALVLWFVACDSSGNVLALPDANWTSDMPIWSSSTMPVIATTTNVQHTSLASCAFYNFKFTASGRTGVMCTGSLLVWCIIEQSTSNSSSAGTSFSPMHNCAVKMVTNTYDYAANMLGNHHFNVRAEGPGSGGSGNRSGITMTSNSSVRFSQVTSVGHVGIGVHLNNTGTSLTVSMDRCVIANNGSDGLSYAAATGTTGTIITRTAITGNGGYGINRSTATVPLYLFGVRTRDNASGAYNDLGSIPSSLVYTTDPGGGSAAANDTLEYVDAATNKDFRIKASATIAPLGFGVSVAKPTVAH